ncbi:MAG: amino acid ABC transporter ATP-binding protein [Bifidobacteriaceae bacterium]|nr:amino acid ABC transporter ATP-binding protein [Bifidobacteriaceae bacterium]
MVEVRGLSKSFGGRAVLEDVDLDIEAGGVTVIVGPSGCGKTTLLRCLNGLEKPDRGAVRIGRAAVDWAANPSKREIAALRALTGFVFQAHHLFPHRTALQNITEGPIHAQKRRVAEAESYGRELLGQVGLGDRGDAYPHQLSGGQQQRVGIARALALRPKLLLFDEPTSALDPEIVGDVLQVMRDLARQGWTMVVVTHEIHFGVRVASQAVFLDGGRVVERGDPRQVLAEPRRPRTQEFLRRVLDPLADGQARP